MGIETLLFDVCLKIVAPIGTALFIYMKKKEIGQLLSSYKRTKRDEDEERSTEEIIDDVKDKIQQMNRGDY